MNKHKYRHKHTYRECLFKEVGKVHDKRLDIIYKGKYCTICGKIREIKSETEKESDTGYWRTLSNKELLDKYKGLNIFKVESIWDKYVTLSTINRK